MENTQPNTESPFPGTKKPTTMVIPVVSGLVLISALLVAFYLLTSKDEYSLTAPEVAQPTAPAVDQTVAALGVQGTSDDPAAIQKDLQATDLDGITAYINEI